MAKPLLGPREAAVGALCIALVGAVVWGATHRTPSAPTAGLPAPEELDSLRPYLRPGPAIPPLDEYGAYVPVGPASEPITEAPAQPAAPPWRVSAILLAGDRPMAIIDDQAVAPGGEVAGGGRVVAIEHDHVVIRAADGTRFILRLSAE